MRELERYTREDEYYLFRSDEVRKKEEFMEHAYMIYDIISSTNGIPSFSSMMLTNNHGFMQYEVSLELVNNFILSNAELEVMAMYETVEDFLEVIRTDEYYQIDTIYKSDLLKMWKECNLFFIDETTTQGIFNAPVKNIW